MNEIKLVILNLFLKLFSYLIVAPNVELKKVKSLRNQKKIKNRSILYFK